MEHRFLVLTFAVLFVGYKITAMLYISASSLHFISQICTDLLQNQQVTYILYQAAVGPTVNTNVIAIYSGINLTQATSWYKVKSDKKKKKLFQLIFLTSFVYNKVPGTKLVAVQMLDGDEVVWSDSRLHTPVLPHYISRSLCGHNFHCNPVQTNKGQNHVWLERTAFISLGSICHAGTIKRILLDGLLGGRVKQINWKCSLTGLQAWTRGKIWSFSSYASASGYGWIVGCSSFGWLLGLHSEMRLWNLLMTSKSWNQGYSHT